MSAPYQPGRSPDELLELVYSRAAAHRRRRRLQAAMAMAIVLSVGGATFAQLSGGGKHEAGLQVAGNPASSSSQSVVAGPPGHLQAPVAARAGGRASSGALPSAAPPLLPGVSPGQITTVADGLGRGSGRGVGQDASGLVVSGSTLYVADSAVGVLRAVDLGNGAERVVAGNGQLSPARPDGPAPGDGGPATASPLAPVAVAAAPGGVVYVAEARRIRKIDASGRITTIAGGVAARADLDQPAPLDSPDGTPASQSTLATVHGLAADAAGNVLFSDGARVRRILADGTLTTVAGGTGEGAAGDGGPATSAELRGPTALTFDGQGDLFVSDPPENRVRRIDHATGIITTAAGSGRSGQDGDGGPATAAALGTPQGIGMDTTGGLDIAVGPCVRRVDTAGAIATVAGQCSDTSASYAGDNGPAAQAHLSGTALATSPTGPVLVGGTVVRSIRLGGAITTVAGTNLPDTGAFPAALGTAEPGPVTAVATQPDGTLWLLADGGNSLYRSSAGGSLEEMATGFALADPACSSIGSSCSNGILGAMGLAVGPDGSAWVADAGRCRVFRVVPGQAPTPVAGGASCGSGGDGGPATSALLNRPSGVATDGLGTLWIADTDNGSVRRVDAGGTINTVASGLGRPAALAVESDGSVVVADRLSGTVTLIAPTGARRVLRPAQGPGQSLAPAGIAFGAQGEVLVADTGRCEVHRIDADGTTSLVAGREVAGQAVCGTAGDGGQATEASLDHPVGVAFGPRGALWLADGRRLRVVGGQ